MWEFEGHGLPLRLIGRQNPPTGPPIAKSSPSPTIPHHAHHSGYFAQYATHSGQHGFPSGILHRPHHNDPTRDRVCLLHTLRLPPCQQTHVLRRNPGLPHPAPHRPPRDPDHAPARRARLLAVRRRRLGDALPRLGRVHRPRALPGGAVTVQRLGDADVPGVDGAPAALPGRLPRRVRDEPDGLRAPRRALPALHAPDRALPRGHDARGGRAGHAGRAMDTRGGWCGERA